MGCMVGGVACRRSLCRRLVLVVASFVTLALGIKVRDEKGEGIEKTNYDFRRSSFS
jgi:hypothetical protein